jgi:hypothetical protein
VTAANEPDKDHEEPAKPTEAEETPPPPTELDPGEIEIGPLLKGFDALKRIVGGGD